MYPFSQRRNKNIEKSHTCYSSVSKELSFLISNPGSIYSSIQFTIYSLVLKKILKVKLKLMLTFNHAIAENSAIVRLNISIIMQAGCAPTARHLNSLDFVTKLIYICSVITDKGTGKCKYIGTFHSCCLYMNFVLKHLIGKYCLLDIGYFTDIKHFRSQFQHLNNVKGWP